MRKVEFVYNNLRFSSEKILKTFKSRTYNKNNPDNKTIILEHLQKRESEKCKGFLSSLSDYEHYLLMFYVCKKNGYKDEDSKFSYASIQRLFFEECDEETLIGIRIANLIYESKMSELNEIRRKYLYLFNQMCKEIVDTECDTALIRDIIDNVNYVSGVSLDENIVKKEINNSKMKTILKKEFEACIIYLLELGEEEILNNKARVSLLINYMRSILLCMDANDIEYIKEILNEVIPKGFKTFEINLIYSFFDNIDSDREKYIGKSKVIV